jgi:hypothetical protein
MIHPGQTGLALFAGGELGAWRRWRIARHVAGCQQCLAHVRDFQSARESLRRARTGPPEDLDWEQLASEIKANIRVGLAAGECVGPLAPRVLRPRWHRAILLAPVALPLIAILFLGLWFGRPRPQPEGTPWVDGTVVQATSEGIELKRGDRMLSLRHPSTGEVTYAVNVQGTVRARYVDEETGQVTIHNVYAQ